MNHRSQIAAIGIYFTLMVTIIPLSNIAVAGKISEATQDCIDCHTSITPGIVADWQNSRHSQFSVEEALAKPELEKRVSSSNIPDEQLGFVVGCAECHMLFAALHKDSFDHNDYDVHTIVTPIDCAACHATEMAEYSENIMSQAHLNLTENALYMDMVNAVNGLQHFSDGHMKFDKADDTTNASACLSCHGTRVTVEGFKERETELGGMTFPVLKGWPNQGVGRINPDGSVGSCTACHARHQFSIELARKPETCSQCHEGPDVPAFKVYSVSKHGNIYFTEGHGWDYEAIPWTVGRDFTAPTCAVCHISLIVDEEGTVIAKRTHRMNDRLDKRLFGLIYSHPHPKSANTTGIRNKAGLPLPTELTGEPASDFLIDKTEQAKRRERMKNVCNSCHASGWVDGHFAMLDKTIETTNAITLTATQILSKIWEEGYVEGLPQGKSIFDDAIERKWVEEWLFYANSTRFAAAMVGADYGVFANGRWQMSKNLSEIHEWLKLHEEIDK